MIWREAFFSVEATRDLHLFQPTVTVVFGKKNTHTKNMNAPWRCGSAGDHFALPQPPATRPPGIPGGTLSAMLSFTGLFWANSGMHDAGKLARKNHRRPKAKQGKQAPPLLPDPSRPGNRTFQLKPKPISSLRLGILAPHLRCSRRLCHTPVPNLYPAAEYRSGAKQLSDSINLP